MLAHAPNTFDELVAAFDQERADHGLRCWLLALIGEARLPDALRLLVEQPHGDDESLRDWAVRGLQMLSTKPAHEQLWRARANGLIG